MTKKEAIATLHEHLGKAQANGFLPEADHAAKIAEAFSVLENESEEEEEEQKTRGKSRK
jgi:hypothetical protein